MCVKRLACNEVMMCNGQTYCPGVVELMPDGRVTKVYQLEEEIAHTIWIGGKIAIQADSKGMMKAYWNEREIKI